MRYSVINFGPQHPSSGKKIYFIFFLFFFYCSLTLFTDTLSADDQKGSSGINAQKEEYKKLQKEMEKQREKLEKTKNLEYSILGELDRTNHEIADVQAELRKYRGKLVVVANEIRKVEADISINRDKLTKQAEWLKRKLRIMQRYGYSGDVVLLLSTSSDISQLMRRWKYIKQITLYDHKMLESYKDTVNKLAEEENHLESLRSELKDREEDIEVNLAAISEKKKDKEVFLASVRKEKTSYDKMLRELKEASDRLLEIIRRSEETESYAIKGFHGMKGKLPWPVNGRVAIPYGTQKDPQFKTPVFRNGVHIKADDDSTARAVYAGKIVFAEWFKGYGQLVIINHGEGYHTLYANLSEIFYKVGDIIKERQAIGRIGESGTLSSPGLYFEIRYKGKPLDPVQWLKRR